MFTSLDKDIEARFKKGNMDNGRGLEVDGVGKGIRNNKMG